MWLRLTFTACLLVIVCGGLWWISSRLNLLQTTQARLVKVETLLSQSQNEIAAMREAAKLDAQFEQEAYEKADNACRQTIRQVVAGTRVVKVPVEEIVYVDREVVTPQDCPAIKLPDLYRVRDIQEAGTNPN